VPLDVVVVVVVVVVVEWRRRGATSDVMGMSSNCWDA